MRAGTIVASNYVEMAKVLGISYLRHHPGELFTILVVDDRPVGDVPERMVVLRLGDLDLTDAEVHLMTTIYDVMELSTAVKPSLLRTLLRDDDLACYLDPDIFVYAPFVDVVESARNTGILLTPHVLEPIPRDGCDPAERTIMQAGVFNLGFIAVGRSGGNFLDWWQQRLIYDAVVEFEVGLFTDQRWVDWVPALFGFERCEDPGMNIAWWNIHERDLGADDPAAPTVAGRPVRFVHFSGYDPDTPEILSKHHRPRPRTTFEPGMAIRSLADRYGAQLRSSGHLALRDEPYRWSRAEDGLVLNELIRRIVRSAVLEEHEAGFEPSAMKTPFAFGPSSSELRPWLEAIDGGTPALPVSRVERGLWSKRIDVQLAFREIDGPDAEGYRRWLSTEPAVVELVAGLRPAVPKDRSGEVGVPSRPRAIRGTYRRSRSMAGRIRRAIKPIPTDQRRF